jgi:hypothetical protein
VGEIIMEIKVNHEYHIVELNQSVGVPKELVTWLTDNLGPVSAGRWFVRIGRIYFYSEKDHLMFLLRWAGK